TGGRGRVEQTRTILPQIDLRRRGGGRPRIVGVPRVRAGLERRRFPREFLAAAVQPVPEPRRLNLLAELGRRVVAAEADEPDRLRLRGVPLAVIPGPGHDQVHVIGIALFGMFVDFPRTPRILLIPEAGDIEGRYGGAVELT